MALLLVGELMVMILNRERGLHFNSKMRKINTITIEEEVMVEMVDVIEVEAVKIEDAVVLIEEWMTAEIIIEEIVMIEEMTGVMIADVILIGEMIDVTTEEMIALVGEMIRLREETSVLVTPDHAIIQTT